LIGAGGIGAYHRAAIEGRQSAGAARLVAIADPTVERLESQKAEVEARGVRWHQDYREMLRLEMELDAVVIATPIPFHYDMALACIARGLMIHLEKPPVPLLSQLEGLIAADTGQAISVGFQMIGGRGVQLLKQAISEGRLGQVRHIRAVGCWPRLDNYYTRASWAGKMTLNGAPVFDGPITNAFAHLVNNVMYFAAEDRDEFAVPEEIEGELYRARPIESYDTALLRGRFASGIDFAIAVTHASETVRLFSMDVCGTKGWARISVDGAKLESNIGLACECPQSTQQLLDINYLNFIDVITGRADRFTTRLADTRGYVSATNAMLASAGGILDIDPAHVRKYQRDGETGYDVAGLGAALEETFATGRLFNEQGCPWATATPRPIRLPLEHNISLT
jgi:predicted dehydrogenase